MSRCMSKNITRFKFILSNEIFLYNISCYILWDIYLLYVILYENENILSGTIVIRLENYKFGKNILLKLRKSLDSSYY